MTDDDSRTQDDAAGESDIPRTYPGHLLEHGRERGLSRADREYLASGGETVENEGTDVNTRIRIRERIRESIVDFWLIAEYLSDHDRDLIFRESDDDWDNWELEIGLKSAMQFFYAALENNDFVDFETVLTSAIHDAERRARRGAALIEVEFDVEVDEQFHVQEAYDKFQRGVPLTPTEIGALLITGRVSEPGTVQKLAQHAHSYGFVEHSIAPLLGKQLAEISGEDRPVESLHYTAAHLPETDVEDLSVISSPTISDYEHLAEEFLFAEIGLEHVSIEDLANESFAEELAKEDEGAEALDGPDDDEEVGGQEDPDAALRELSLDLDEPITVGDDVVYEDGDRHTLDNADGDEKGAGSPADTDDDADDAEG